MSPLLQVERESAKKALPARPVGECKALSPVLHPRAPQPLQGDRKREGGVRVALVP